MEKNLVRRKSVSLSSWILAMAVSLLFIPTLSDRAFSAGQKAKDIQWVLPSAGLVVKADGKRWTEVNVSGAFSMRAVELFLMDRQQPKRKRMVMSQVFSSPPKAEPCPSAKREVEKAEGGLTTFAVGSWDCVYSVKDGDSVQYLASRTLERSYGKGGKLWSSVVVMETGAKPGSDEADFKKWISSMKRTAR